MADKEGVRKVLFITGFIIAVFVVVMLFNFSGSQELTDATGSQLYDLPTSFSSFSLIYIFLFVILIAVLLYLYFKT
ncbi:hypothetical protein GF371_03070 [Candidatus Woesearchaeota archaeon]|nr:hypothetical protein [Candidatus Woesearchaeota archaeon]